MWIDSKWNVKSTNLSSMTSSGLRASPNIRRRASWYSFCLCSKVFTGRARLSPFAWPLPSDDGRFNMRMAGSGIMHWDPIHALSSTVTLHPFSELVTGAHSFNLICCSNWNNQAHAWIMTQATSQTFRLPFKYDSHLHLRQFRPYPPNFHIRQLHLAPPYLLTD